MTTKKPRLSDLDHVDIATGESADKEEEEDPRLTCR